MRMSAVEMTKSLLTDAQVAVAQAFFELPESAGFVVAGGAALLALGLSSRPTQDLDVFTSPATTDVAHALAAFERLAASKSWSIERMTTEPTFCRFTVDVDSEKVLVDLAIDTAAVDPPTVTILGPTMSELDVAARKVVALFDRAAARDFVDVYVLSQQFDRDELLRRAMQIDLGLDLDIFASMLESHERFEDVELILTSESVAEIRRFFDAWSETLRSSR